MEKSNQKKALVLSVIGVLTLIAVVVGATFAYFAAQSGGTGNIDVNAGTATTDNLSFSVGEAISIIADQSNFAQGLGNQAGSTTASAMLTANNATNTATRNYYLYLDITSNDFIYTVDENTPELILTITDPEGNPVTSISGLSYKENVTTTVTGGESQIINGFDITTQTGLITIADNYEITATNTSTTQEWVTLVNLDSDQEENTGKTFEASLIIREDSPIGITEVSTSNITTDSITLTVDAESENTITNYYFAKNEEEYVSSASNTYTFTGLDAATEYTLKVYVVDDEGYQSAVYSTEETTADPTLADVCPEGGNLASCIQTYYTTYGEEIGGLYLHDGSGTYGAQEAGDNSYRYAGANPNNYVCFGSDAATCPADNLYRIIGIFYGQVKLIKNTSIGNNYWSGSFLNSSNTWSSSTLNTGTLNGTYLDGLGSEWSDKIATTNWKVGGITSVQRSTPPKSVYNYEVGSSSSSTTYSAKVGLMYLSEYGYAASPENWTVNMNVLDTATNRDNNWMFMGLYEWTISRVADDTFLAFRVNDTGNVGYNFVGNYSIYAVRPSFYLESSVEFSEGDGTEQNPFRIVV